MFDPRHTLKHALFGRSREGWRSFFTWNIVAHLRESQWTCRFFFIAPLLNHESVALDHIGSSQILMHPNETFNPFCRHHAGTKKKTKQMDLYFLASSSQVRWIRWGRHSLLAVPFRTKLWNCQLNLFTLLHPKVLWTLSKTSWQLGRERNVISGSVWCICCSVNQKTSEELRVVLPYASIWIYECVYTHIWAIRNYAA